MTEQNEEKDSVFLTALYMVLFYFIFSVTEIVLIFLAVVQVLMMLLANEPNPKLQRFGAQLGVYVADIVRYLSMKSSIKPYPFCDWPNDPDPEDEA